MPIVTNTGIQVITQSEYAEKLKNMYLSIDKTWVLDANSPDGQKVILDSRMLWEVEQEAVKVANGRDPRTATGSAVDDIASMFDVFRAYKRQSVVTFDLIGDAGTVVKSGSQIKNTQTLTVWTLNDDVTIPAPGAFTSVDYGLITANAPFEPLTLIDGWTGVDNQTNFIIGREDQTDAQLEEERRAQVTKSSTSMRASVKAAILAVENVNSADVIENDESTAVDGQDANSIHCIVSGGDEVEICRAIESKISLGCKSVGTIEHLITSEDDPYGMTRRFDRPTLVDIWVRYTIVGGAKIPSEAMARIPEYVESYAAGSVDLPFYSNDNGFTLGQSPSTDLLMTPLNWAIGQYIAEDSAIYTSKVELSRDGTNWTETKVSISRFEQPLFDAVRVEVLRA